ncbi:AbgT family transporter [Luteimonas sp. RD2P54]|uniref:AbgT family transporter n=1 Tax=Luteimonas endophytica TaxID=3042023 RepID=A0ABT6JAN1_9GAMM|nr:AbgT family transporter [Luteimonas endophytica]MDH5823866.1 AbgT family transporter [Luteimonas endophytica]
MPRFLRVPHTLVLLFAMMILALVSTWVLPQGEFRTVEDAKGHALVVPGTYAEVEERTVLSPLALFTVVPRALAAAQDIIFFVLIVGGAIAVLRASGLIDAVLGWILKRVGHSPGLLIVIGMGVFALGSGTIGVAEEYIPFAAMLIALCLAMRMDVMTAMGIMICGYGIGYGVAALNPFTVIIAQGVAGLEPTSGWEYRLALFVPFVAIGVHHVWSYARRVRNDPDASLMKGIEVKHVPPTEYPPLGGRKLVLLLATLVTLGLMVWGITARGWYLVELGALFLGLAIFVGLAGGLGADGSARRFAEGAAELAGTALLIGFARSIALLLEDGRVLHTIVDALAAPLTMVGAEIAVVGMLLVQTVLNLFIPSGSGQAFVTMPIMAPLGDLVGVSRQVSVLAYQFGDGFSNMIVPTNVVLMSILGVAGIPYDRWFRFVWPLLVKLTIAASVALVVAVMIGYR